jgi:hypothetical protein
MTFLLLLDLPISVNKQGEPRGNPHHTSVPYVPKIVFDTGNVGEILSGHVHRVESVFTANSTGKKPIHEDFKFHHFRLPFPYSTLSAIEVKGIQSFFSFPYPVGLCVHSTIDIGLSTRKIHEKKIFFGTGFANASLVPNFLFRLAWLLRAAQSGGSVAALPFWQVLW